MRSAASRAHRKTPVRLTFSTAFHCASDIDLRFIDNVGLVGHFAHTESRALRAGLLEIRRMDVERRDLGAFGGEGERHGPAESAAAAGDGDQFPGKLHEFLYCTANKSADSSTGTER